MTDLVEFLRALYDDIEARERKKYGIGIGLANQCPSCGGATSDYRGTTLGTEVLFLADLQARREFLDFAVRTRDLAEQQPTEGQARELRVKWASYLTALKFDALPHADHPDYRQEWRP